MKNLLRLLSAMVFTVSGMAQTSISGTVLEKDSDLPLLGVSVLVKGTTTGTTSDLSGNYSLNNVAEDAILEFSYLGFKTLEVPVTGQVIINVRLEEDGQKLDEVVVTALNIERDKESLGYSISQVDATQVNVVRENNVMNSKSL